MGPGEQAAQTAGRLRGRSWRTATGRGRVAVMCSCSDVWKGHPQTHVAAVLVHPEKSAWNLSQWEDRAVMAAREDEESRRGGDSATRPDRADRGGAGCRGGAGGPGGEGAGAGEWDSPCPGCRVEQQEQVRRRGPELRWPGSLPPAQEGDSPPARAEAERPGEGVPVRSQERGSGWRSRPCLDSEGRRVTEATPAGPGGCSRGCGVCSWWDSPSPSDFSPPLGPDGGESPARRSQSQAARRRCGTGTVGSRLVRTASRGFTDLLNFPVVNTHKR